MLGWVLIPSAGMRTEINKKRGRLSEWSKEAQAKGAKGAKRGNNSWGVGGGGRGKPPTQTESGGAAP